MPYSAEDTCSAVVAVAALFKNVWQSHIYTIQDYEIAANRVERLEPWQCHPDLYVDRFAYAADLRERASKPMERASINQIRKLLVLDYSTSAKSNQ